LTQTASARCSDSLGGSGVDDFLLEVGGLGEAEGDLVGGELVEAVGDGGGSALHDFLVKGVKEDLGVSSSVHVDSGGLSGDAGGEALQKKVN